MPASNSLAFARGAVQPFDSGKATSDALLPAYVKVRSPRSLEEIKHGKVVSMSLRRVVLLPLCLVFSLTFFHGPTRGDDPPARTPPENAQRISPRRPTRRVVPRKSEVKSRESDPAADASKYSEMPLDGFPDVKLPKPDSIKPSPEVAIPDNPPPHEGEMFDLPLMIEPPDLLLVEVLEGLPGKPITGERLVRPDGTISLGFYGDVHVRGLTPSQVKEKIVLYLRKDFPDEVLGLVVPDREGGSVRIVAPRDSDRVFVDLTAYNSKFYYVQGEVTAPGKMPITGSETVLDALVYAGGLLGSSDTKKIWLIRPARGGKPTRTLTVDLKAILNGDKTKNYQIFPGDRLVFERDEQVQAAARQERQAASFQTLAITLRQALVTSREIVEATPDLKPEERVKLVREWVEIWEKSAQKPGAAGGEVATFRALLMKAVEASAKPPAAEKPERTRP